MNFMFDLSLHMSRFPMTTSITQMSQKLRRLVDNYALDLGIKLLYLYSD